MFDGILKIAQKHELKKIIKKKTSRIVTILAKDSNHGQIYHLALMDNVLHPSRLDATSAKFINIG